MDAIPGHPNNFWIQRDKPGTYLGTCAEFCETGHAWMRIRVVAQPEADIDPDLTHLASRETLAVGRLKDTHETPASGYPIRNT
jgi:heme/copper-type cytochrome/quinol oxidase subunit 2